MLELPFKPKLPSKASQPAPFTKADWITAVGCGLLAAILITGVAIWQGDALAVRSLGGRWFQSDGWRAFDDMVDFHGDRHRTQIRPLFSLIMIPLTLLLKSVFQLSNIQAVWGANALCIALWGGMIFLTFRLMGLSRLMAAIASLFGTVSGAALFWFTVPETYGLSSLALISCIFLAAYANRYKTSDISFILVGAFCLGTLLTNWWPALAMNFVYKKPLKAIGLALASLCLVTLSWGVQKVVFPQPAAVFVKLSVASEKEYILHEEQGSLLDKLHSAIISSVVVPAIDEYEQDSQLTGKRLTIQRSSLTNSGWFYGVLAIAWLSLLVAGTIKLLKTPQLKRFSLTLLAAIAGQLALHAVYGEETFLYSLHFATLLVILAGTSLLAIPRRTVGVAGLASLLVVSILFNNLHRLQDAASTPDLPHYDERLLRLPQMQEVNGTNLNPSD